MCVSPRQAPLSVQYPNSSRPSDFAFIGTNLPVAVRHAAQTNSTLLGR